MSYSGERYPRYVYAIQHNVTKRIYIGSSNCIEKRYKQHIIDLRRGKHTAKLMQKDFDEYGENFSLFQLDIIDSQINNDLEYIYMNKYNTFDESIGYNQGDKNYKGYKEIIVKISEGLPIPNDCDRTGIS